MSRATAIAINAGTMTLACPVYSTTKTTPVSGIPFFVWFNTTRMHAFTHGKDESQGQAGRWQSEYHDVMIDHDGNIGEILDFLDELGITDDSIVVYSTDNGPHMNTWPDGGMTPFRSEKNSNWERAFRVPAMVRRPGHIGAGTVLNGIMSHADWFVTFLSAAGVPDVAERLRAGAELDGKDYKVYLDGHDQFDYVTGAADESPRNYFFYMSDDGDLTAMRFDNWKFVFLEQRVRGTLAIWMEPFVELRMPKLFNLRTDPYERAEETSNRYFDWILERAFLFAQAQSFVAEHIQSLADFPVSQKPAAFNLEQVMAKLEAGIISS